MRRFLFPVLFLLCAARLEAQPAPTIVTTLQTTNTGTTSLQVGCAIGSGTCTGGIVAGPISSGPISIASGYLEIQSNVPVSQVNRLVNNGGTLQWGGSALALGGAVGPGTTGKLTKFTGANSIGDSICTESGTTISCVNTVSATTLTGTLSTASQTNITGVGTITTGTWTATKIGLLYGGTNADLSGTGGTSQFLRQNTLGGAVTVVRPAVADLSDASNVALLNATNTFTVNQQNETPSTATQYVAWVVTNTGGTTYFGADSSTAGNFGTGANYAAVVDTSSTGGLSLWSTNASAPIRFGTNGALRWGVNSAGDFTFGASSHIADSSGTPTVLSGCGGSTTVVGADYGFLVSKSSSTDSSCNVNFGHTFSNAPICTASPGAGPIPVTSVSTSTTGVTIGYGSTATVGNFFVLCKGY